MSTSEEVRFTTRDDSATLSRKCKWAVIDGTRLFCANKTPVALVASYILLDRDEAVGLVANVTFFTHGKK